MATHGSGAEDGPAQPDLTRIDTARLRVEYSTGGIDDDEPFAGWLPTLEAWMTEAVAAPVPEPNAMVLATVDATGAPATRTVLCKGIDERGLQFFTNLDSDKGRDLRDRPVASVTFPWYVLARQVTVRGVVVELDRAETEAYWRVRPRGAQIGAWASRQSRPIGSRAALLAARDEVEARFADREVPVPPFWGACSSNRCRSSSGRAAPIVCTTGSARVSSTGGGSPSVCNPDRAPGVPGRPRSGVGPYVTAGGSGDCRGA